MHIKFDAHLLCFGSTPMSGDNCPSSEWSVMCRPCCEYHLIQCRCPSKGSRVGYTVPCCRNALDQCDPCIIHPGTLSLLLRDFLFPVIICNCCSCYLPNYFSVFLKQAAAACRNIKYLFIRCFFPRKNLPEGLDQRLNLIFMVLYCISQ